MAIEAEHPALTCATCKKHYWVRDDPFRVWCKESDGEHYDSEDPKAIPTPMLDSEIDPKIIPCFTEGGIYLCFGEMIIRLNDTQVEALTGRLALHVTGTSMARYKEWMKRSDPELLGLISSEEGGDMLDKIWNGPFD